MSNKPEVAVQGKAKEAFFMQLEAMVDIEDETLKDIERFAKTLYKKLYSLSTEELIDILIESPEIMGVHSLDKDWLIKDTEAFRGMYSDERIREWVGTQVVEVPLKQYMDEHLNEDIEGVDFIRIAATIRGLEGNPDKPLTATRLAEILDDISELNKGLAKIESNQEHNRVLEIFAEHAKPQPIAGLGWSK